MINEGLAGEGKIKWYWGRDVIYFGDLFLEADSRYPQVKCMKSTHGIVAFTQCNEAFGDFEPKSKVVNLKVALET